MVDGIAFQWEVKNYNTVYLFDILEFFFMKNVLKPLRSTPYTSFSLRIKNKINVSLVYVLGMFLKFWPFSESTSLVCEQSLILI